MKGSYLAKIIESEQQREKRLRELYQKKKKYIDKNCENCQNKKTDLCHITEDIKGNTMCVNKRSI